MPSADPEELANRRRARDDPLRLMERRAIEAEEQVGRAEKDGTIQKTTGAARSKPETTFQSFMEIAGPLVRAPREVSSITMPRRPHVARCTDSLCALPMMPRESCRQPESISCLVRTVLGAADWPRRQPHHPETP